MIRLSIFRVSNPSIDATFHPHLIEDGDFSSILLNLASQGNLSLEQIEMIQKLAEALHSLESLEQKPK